MRNKGGLKAKYTWVLYMVLHVLLISSVSMGVISVNGEGNLFFLIIWFHYTVIVSGVLFLKEKNKLSDWHWCALISWLLCIADPLEWLWQINALNEWFLSKSLSHQYVKISLAVGLWSVGLIKWGYQACVGGQLNKKEHALKAWLALASVSIMGTGFLFHWPAKWQWEDYQHQKRVMVHQLVPVLEGLEPTKAWQVIDAMNLKVVPPKSGEESKDPWWQANEDLIKQSSSGTVLELRQVNLIERSKNNWYFWIKVNEKVWVVEDLGVSGVLEKLQKSYVLLALVAHSVWFFGMWGLAILHVRREY